VRFTDTGTGVFAASDPELGSRFSSLSSVPIGEVASPSKVGPVVLHTSCQQPLVHAAPVLYEQLSVVQAAEYTCVASAQPLPGGVVH
jgi:hypothetical protein